MDHMAHKYLFVKRGGHSSPKDCKSYQKVAIIVPYRDRMHHLKILLNRLHPMLYKQQIEYRIFLVEQVCWWCSIIAIYHLLPIQCSPLIEYYRTCSIWASKLQWLYKFVLNTMYCHWPKYSFFWYLFHMLPVEHWEPNCTSSSLPVDRKYQKGQSRDNYIILLFNSRYKKLTLTMLNQKWQ